MLYFHTEGGEIWLIIGLPPRNSAEISFDSGTTFEDVAHSPSPDSDSEVILRHGGKSYCFRAGEGEERGKFYLDDQPLKHARGLPKKPHQ